MSAMILSPLPAPLVALTAVELHRSRTRDDTTPVALTPVLVDGDWTVDPGTVVGRFYLRLTGTDAVDAATTVDPITPVDLPEDETLVVSPETVAVRAGMTLPLSPDDRDAVTEAIRDAQDDVAAYLGRPIVPTAFMETNRYAYPDGWDLVAAPDEPLIRVLSATPELDSDGNPTDYFTVTYLAGLDARTDPALRPIRRYVALHAMNSPEFTALWRVRTTAKGEVRSLSADGQSVSFAPATLGGGGQAGSAAPGALPTLASLDRWRVAGRRAHQSRTRTVGWPYAPMGGHY